MSYHISVGRSAERSLKRRIPPDHAGRIRQAIDRLAEEPRPRVGRKLQGMVDHDRRVVPVVEAWHRQRGYR